MDKELLADFAEESQEILEGAEELILPLEDGEGSPEDIIKAAGQIDGIIGCAKTMGIGSDPQLEPLFKNIGNLSEGFKFLGYRAGQVNNEQILTVIGGILAEAIELLQSAVRDLSKGYISVDQGAVDRSFERMMWVAKKLNLSEEDIKALEARFGL